MHDSIKDQIEKIHEGITNLKQRTDFNILKLNDRLWLIKNVVNHYRQRKKIESVEHLIEIFLETSIASPEGSEAYNESIWNANIEVRGKQTTLGELFDELRKLVENYKAEKAKRR